MINKSIVNNFIKLGIRTWLKSITTRIEIQNINLIYDNKFFGKIDEIYIEASNIIYNDLFINKIIIKSYDFYLKFNFKNNLIHSEKIIVNSFLSIDSINLKNIFFSSNFKSLRNKVQEVFTENINVSSLIINNDLITIFYGNKESRNKMNLKLKLEDNIIFLENIKSKKSMLLLSDENIKFNNCQIQNELVKVELLSRVIFDD